MTKAYKCDGCGALIENTYTAEVLIPFDNIKVFANLNYYHRVEKYSDEDQIELDLCSKCIGVLIKNLTIKTRD